MDEEARHKCLGESEWPEKMKTTGNPGCEDRCQTVTTSERECVYFQRCVWGHRHLLGDKQAAMAMASKQGRPAVISSFGTMR
ncbi:uncharacterized protein ACWYII_026450 isoform 2-T2 [Salvelinus alpinus]